MKTKLLTASLLLASFTAFTTFVFAQESENSEYEYSEDFDFVDQSELDEEFTSIDAISKYEQQDTETPAVTTIMTADEIQRYGYRELSDILNSMRGFFSSYDHNYNYLNVRGIGVPGDANSRILVLVDGHRINENIQDSAAIGTDFTLDVDLIERVEVVRGPGSMAFGSNAVFGVVNIITKKGRDYSGIHATAELGTYDRNKVKLTYGDRLDNGVEILLSASKMKTDGVDYLYFSEYDNGEHDNNGGIAQNLDSDEYTRLFASLNYGAFTIQAASIERTKAIPTGAFNSVFNDPINSSYDEHLYGNIQYANTFGKTDITARIAYDDYKRERSLMHYPHDAEGHGADTHMLDMTGTHLGEEGENTLFVDLLDGEWLSANLQAVRSFGRHRITLGGEYRDNVNTDQTGGHPGEHLVLNSQLSNTVISHYIQDDISLTDNFMMSMGLRHDKYSEHDGHIEEAVGHGGTGGHIVSDGDHSLDTTNPRIAFVYVPNDKRKFKLVHGTAYRAPNVNELFYQDGGLSQEAALNLEPESNTTTEIVYEQKFLKNYRSIVSVYKNHVEDLISLTTDPLDGLLLYHNSGELDVEGLDIALEGNWDNDRSISFEYGYANASQHSGGAVANSPKNTFKLHALSPLMDDKLMAGLEVLYISDRASHAADNDIHGAMHDVHGEGDDLVDGYTLVNFSLLGEKVYKDLDMSFSIYNLFDKEYYDSGSHQHRQREIHQLGRNFRFKLAYKF